MRLAVAIAAGAWLVAALAWPLVLRVRGRSPMHDDTWGCGYAAPSARMQYTARSFSEQFAERLLPRPLAPRVRVSPLRGWFPAPVRLASEDGDPITRGGDAHVDRSIESATEFTRPFQDFISRTAWGDIWARPGLDHRTRRLLTLAILTAVGNEHELDMHIRAALRAGIDPDDLVEVFLHTAVYAGVPNSNRAFALGKQALVDTEGGTGS